MPPRKPKKAAPRKRAPRAKPAPDDAREPTTALAVYIPPPPPPPEEPRRVFTEEERALLGDPLADHFEALNAGPFVDPRAHRVHTRYTGRPPKLTAERALKVLGAIAKSSASYEAACAIAGISYNALKEWRRKGKLDNADPLYRHFRAALARAVALSEGALTEVLRRHANTDFRAAVAILERRFKRWRPPAVAVKGDPDHPLLPTEVTFRLTNASAPPGVKQRGDE